MIPAIPVGQRHALELRRLRDSLQSGAVVFYVNPSISETMPKEASPLVLDAISALKRGASLSQEQEKLVSANVRAQVLEPVTLERAK
jgi:hypothetical protein